MSSVSVAAAAATDTTISSAGKLPPPSPVQSESVDCKNNSSTSNNNNNSDKGSGLPAASTLAARAEEGVAGGTAQVVIIKAESCEETVTSVIQNGATAGVTIKGVTMNSSSGAEGAAVVLENGAMESLEAGLSKVAINGTNQNRMIRTASAKGKHLTRSHAMRESASPPRTPTICNGGGSQSQNADEHESVADSHPASPPEVITPPKIYPADSGKAPSQLDLDFPKLNAPKPKSPRNMEKSQSSSDSSKSVNSLDPHSPTATLSRKGEGLGRNLSPSSQHSNKELSALDHDNSPLLSPGSYDNRSGSGREHSKSPSGENRNSSYHGGNSGGKKHKGASAAKNAKTPRLKAQGSSSSVEGNNNSTVFISKDNSFEQFTDQSGVDLIKFFRETLNKNTKDRSMLLKIEKELHDLATDRNRHQVKFPSMSSYNRMLIHRCAAYFGMDHNVDTSQTSVIVAVTKSTRIPEILFHTLLRDTLDEPRKSILKRDSHSFDECRQSLLPNPDRGLLDRKAKSFEEREEEYEKARRRIFKGREMVGYGRSMDMQDENSWPWSSTESSDNSTKIKAQNNRLLKVHSLSVDTRHDRPSVSKSHSFGGYGGPSGGGNHHSHHLNRGDSITSTKSAGPRFFTKQDSIGGTPWRLSPSSSGYKTQTQSLRSDSITPSPTGYGSGGDHTPEPQSAQSPGAAGNRSVVWAVTDMASVPRGSVLIDPQTLQPIVNQDGSIYYFDPSNVPAIAMKMTHHGQINRHYPPPFMTGGSGGGGGGGGGGHPSNRRRTERNKGPGEEIGSVGNKEKSISHTGSIDVIPEDQLQANCAPTDINVTSANSGSAVPSEEGSQYTKGETPSPEDLEDTSDKGGMISVEAVDDIEEDLMEDNVERIFVPEHKNQATSPSHPMAEQCEEFVVAAASDSELASSSQCLTPQVPPPPPPLEQDHQPLQSPPPSSSTMTESEAIEVPSTEATGDDHEKDVAEEEPVELNAAETAANEAPSEPSVELEGSPAAVAVECVSAAVVTNGSSTDSHTLTISTTCTSSSSTHSNAATADSNTAAKAEEAAQTSSSGSYSAPPRTYHKTFNRYNNHNSQGDPRSGSTTIASPSNTSTGYQVHHQQQYVAQAPLRHEDQMQAYQTTGITYSTTAIDANGNTYATGASNMPYTATYQQMPESGGYMVYAAPYPMETVGEMPGYYVPVYDQAGNATLVPASTGARDHQQTTTILQAAPPPGTAVYQTAPNTTLIPALPAGSQLVYAPEGQFGAAGLQQPQQFAAMPTASYPPGTTVTYAPYGTAYNAPSTYHPNFWGQPMTTYYVSSPPAPTVQQATAVPIQIPVQMPPQQQQPVNTQPQTVKSGTHSSPQTPQATTFAGNPFNAAGGHMQMNVSVNGVMSEAMPPPIYAMPMGGGGHPGGQHHHGPSKYQNVNLYPYSAPVVPASATPPTAIYQQPPSQSYQPPAAGKPGTAQSPPQAIVAAAGSSNDPQTNPSSTTSTPLQKSPPTQMPETASNSTAAAYERKPRRGPPTEMSGSTQSQQNTGPPPRTHGYLGNNYNSAYARNPNQTYTPRGYAPKKHYGTEGGAPNGMAHNKPIVLNTPMNHQSSPSPGIYGHYHHPSAAASGAAGVVQGPTHHSHPAGIRGPRPKPANLDLRRTGSHYQSQNVGGGGGASGASASVAGNGNSQRNTPSTNSTESNNSPNSVTGGGGGVAVSGGHGNGMGDHHSRSNNGQMGYYPAPNSGGVPHHGGHPLVMHQPLMGSPANPVGAGGHPGMYVKLGQTYFPHPTLATPMGGNRRSPPNEIRPQFNHHPHSLTTGLYPMNMQISGPRHGASGPRHSHHNSYKGSR